MTTMRIVTACFGLIAILAVGTTVQGQSDPEAEAQTLFLEGRTALEEERFDAAAVLFSSSLERHPRVSTAFNLAFALAGADRLTEAMRWLDRVEAGEFGQLDEEQTRQLPVFRAETEARLGRLVFTLEGVQSADVFIDGEASSAVTRDSELVQTVDPGTHEVEARREGSREFSAEVSVESGATERLTIRFETVEPAPITPRQVAVAAATEQQSQIDEHSPEDDSGGVPTWVWIGGGVLVAAAAAVVIVLLATGGEEDVLANIEVLRVLP